MTAPEETAAPTGTAPTGDARALTDTVARLRRVLRTSIRTDYPWESLPMAQVEVLQLLQEIAPARVGDLAARLRLSPSTVSGLVGQLMTAGLVKRGTDPGDRRVSVVELTDAGSEQLAEWTKAHERRIAAALERLGGVERSAISAALPALAQLVEHLAETQPGGGQASTAA
jgi:DNA-binding MarR family transcriptional regulator